MKKNILLLGGSGFIGKNILESYFRDKYYITAPTSKELNLLDPESINSYFFKDEKFDAVIYSVNKQARLNVDDPTNVYFENKNVAFDNLKMFFNFLKHRGRYSKLIHLGSGSCYDKSRSINNVLEYSIWDSIPQDEHGFYKHMISQYITNYINNLSVRTDIVDLRLFGVFGKYEEDMRFPTSTIKKCLNNEDIIINDDRYMSFLYVNDLLPVLEHFINNEITGAAYNVVPSTATSIKELAEIIKAETNSSSNIIIRNKMSENTKHYVGCNDRLKITIPSVNFTELKEAVKQLVDFHGSKE